MLRGHVIELHPAEPEHLEMARAWRNDPRYFSYFQSIWPILKEESEQWYESTLGGITDMLFIIYDPKTREYLGTVGWAKLDLFDRTAEFGRILVIKRQAEHGLRGDLRVARDALSTLIAFGFTELALNKITSRYLEFNRAAARLNRELGGVEEGRLRKAFFAKGRWWDIICMGLTRREWELREAPKE
jgi:RimJ/RimL family protein N-acetyltransferase